MIVFDIETGPLSQDFCRQFMPEGTIQPPLGQFDPDAVKLGNLKDFDKIQAKMETARIEHEAARANWFGENQKRENEFFDRCSLDACTCEVLAIGYKWDNGEILTHVQDDNCTEAELLEWFWKMALEAAGQAESMIGFNIFGFDLPIILRRSLIMGIDVPNKLLEPWRSKLYFHSLFKDILEVWRCGSRDYIKLDVLARAFGCGAKPDDMNGGDFHKVLRADRERAIAYLKNDLEMTMGLARRFQLV